MKNLKSLFALITLVSLSFACASVTDANLSDELNAPQIEQNGTTGTVFGDDSKPIITKPNF